MKIIKRNNAALPVTQNTFVQMKSPTSDQKLTMFCFGHAESKDLIAGMADTELRTGVPPHSATVGNVVADHFIKALGTTASGIQAGRLYQVVNSAQLMEGVGSGTLQHMFSAAGNIYGDVTSKATGQIAGKLQFVPAGGAMVTAPVLGLQILNAVAGTVQLQQINASLDTLQRAMDRSSVRSEANDVAKIITATELLDDLMKEQEQIKRFTPTMSNKLNNIEQSSRESLIRYSYLFKRFSASAKKAKSYTGKAGAKTASIFLEEEGPQFIQDLDLLIACVRLDIRVHGALIMRSLEDTPQDSERRSNQLNSRISQHGELLANLPKLSDLEQHIESCVNQMSWFQRKVTARSLCKRASSTAEQGFYEKQSQILSDINIAEKQNASLVFWIDDHGNREVRVMRDVEPARNQCTPVVARPHKSHKVLRVLQSKEPLKVFEFAKEMGVETLTLMDKIREWRLPVRSHMATLTSDQMFEIKGRLRSNVPPFGKADGL